MNLYKDVCFFQFLRGKKKESNGANDILKLDTKIIFFKILFLTGPVSEEILHHSMLPEAVTARAAVWSAVQTAACFWTERGAPACPCSRHPFSPVFAGPPWGLLGGPAQASGGSGAWGLLSLQTGLGASQILQRPQPLCSQASCLLLQELVVRQINSVPHRGPASTPQARGAQAGPSASFAFSLSSFITVFLAHSGVSHRSR